MSYGFHILDLFFVVVSNSTNSYKATVMPLWLVWASSFTIPVRVPVKEFACLCRQVGDFEQFKIKKIDMVNNFIVRSTVASQRG